MAQLHDETDTRSITAWIQSPAGQDLRDFMTVHDVKSIERCSNGLIVHFVTNDNQLDSLA